MVIRKPHYYDRFQCVGGSCPDTCCAAWDIPVDEESAAFYAALEGELGEKVRAALAVDTDGELCFSVEHGKCPLVTAQGLCTLQLELGHDALCEECRNHPRFAEEFGFFREQALAASCPAAIPLIVGEDPLVIEEVTDEADVLCEDVDAKLLDALLPCRERAFALLEGDGPWRERLAALLNFGIELQLALAAGGEDELSAVAAEWENIPVPAVPPAPEEETRETLLSCLDLLGEMEILDEVWAADVAAAAQRIRAGADRPLPDEAPERRWVWYLLWRWFLRADFDGDIYGKIAFAVGSVLMLRALSRGEGWMEWARRWAKEVEHSAGNLHALYEAFYTREALSPHRLMGAL